MKDLTKPKFDEYEITVFGTGRGESSVIHLGNGKWAVIDSCYHPGTKIPAAIEYLGKIGVSPKTDISLVIATHWHEDHIKGISHIFKMAESAHFAFPASYSSTLHTVIARAKSSPAYETSGVFELSEIFIEISRRKQKKVQCNRDYAIHDKRIVLSGIDPEDCVVTALSPSDEVFSKYIEKIQISEIDGHISYVEYPEKNDISLATWFQFKETAFLFGADLENGSNDDEGWRGMVQRFKGRLTNAEFIKIPHHGSAGAHNDDLWINHLIQKPIAVVTSFTGSKNPPPTQSDIDRLSKKCGKLFLTGSKKLKKLKASNSDYVAQSLLTNGSSITTTNYYSTGRVTLRKQIGSAPETWKSEVQHGAQLI